MVAQLLSSRRRFFINIMGALLVSSATGPSFGAPLHVRVSEPHELMFSREAAVPPLRPWPNGEDLPAGTSNHWVHDGNLWKLIDREHPGEPDQVLTSLDPLSIAVPLFDYRRDLDFEIRMQRADNEFAFDATAIVPLFTTADFRYPEDFTKEFVHPIGTLPIGDYMVTVRKFDIVPDAAVGDFREIDFAEFSHDPVSYDLPSGFELETVTERLSISIKAGRGDFNGSGALDAEDVDLLNANLRSQQNVLEFDLDGNGELTSEDRNVWINEVVGSYYGDANLDGEFNSTDFVDVFIAGEYEDGIVMNSSWATGDWSGDGEFDSEDLVLAFQFGGFERSNTAHVPEPNVATLGIPLCIAMAVAGRRMRRCIDLNHVDN